MRYGLSSVGSAYIPKLLGIYERELAPLIDEACLQESELVVDIGAAEGYYAVGLAIRNPCCKVVAFETESRGRQCLREMAELNAVIDRLDIRGKCEASDLERALAGNLRSLVICDVEGYEVQLLDPAAVPSLSTAVILAEMHDFIHPGSTDLLYTRFANTHEIRQIFQEPRSRSDFPWRTLVTALLPRSYLNWATSEWRPVRMSWLWMEPRLGR
jgi:hypothetical protein